MGLAEVGDDAGLLTGRGEDGLGGELAAAGAQAGGHGGHLDAAGAHALAQAQEQGSALVLGLQAQEQDLAGPLQVAVGDGAQAGSGHSGGQEGVLLQAVGAHALVDVVGAQDGTGETGPGPGVLQGEAATGQEPHSPVGGGARQSLGGDVQGVGPGGGDELTGLLVAHERHGEAVGLGGPGEGETVLVGDPLLVDLGVVAGQVAQDDAAAHVDADGRAGGVVLGDGVGGDQVHGAGPEAVLRGGQGAHGADLDDVAGEVGGEGPPGGVQVLAAGAQVGAVVRAVGGAGLAAGAGEVAQGAQGRHPADRLEVGIHRLLGRAGGEVQDAGVEAPDLLGV